MKSTCFVFKLKQVLIAHVLIEDLRFLPLVREIQRLSTRYGTLHSCKDGISHTFGRNPRSSIGTCDRTYQFYDILVPSCTCVKQSYISLYYLLQQHSFVLIGKTVHGFKCDLFSQVNKFYLFLYQILLFFSEFIYVYDILSNHLIY